MSAAMGQARRQGRPSGPLKPIDERLELISEHLLREALARTPLDHYVVWNGCAAMSRGESLRARAIACIHEVGEPVSLRVLLQRAARLRESYGLNPDLVRSAIRQHQIAKPAVLLLVEKRPSGEYVAVSDVPFAGQVGRRLRAGEVVVTRDGACLPGFVAQTQALVA